MMERQSRVATAEERATATKSMEGQREIVLLDPRVWSHPAEVGTTSTLCKERRGHGADRVAAGNAA